MGFGFDFGVIIVFSFERKDSFTVPSGFFAGYVTELFWGFTRTSVLTGIWDSYPSIT